NFTIVGFPTNGTLLGFDATNGSVNYLPNSDFYGSDTLTFIVTDGALTSAVATIFITVVPVNDMPIASNQNLTISEDNLLPITLTGFDVDGPVTNFTVVTPPANGT